MAWERHSIHCVNEFMKILWEMLNRPPFDGNQRLLSRHTGIDTALLSRVLNGTRNPTPEFVGRLGGTLPAPEAAKLLKVYLEEVVAEITRTKRKTGSKGAWTPALGHLAISVSCEARKKSA
ncbi:hypothetical protein AW736_05910 [Termitidicoccus mucosus]|uniref:Uncharacterized protein n=2 Tax=Termitidicoccus mucosus TaxID=1184151 RepID=A0A178INQ8_9BACT|nr:hypothetical protein AW736_05910 [Opitutaceae bacterium TSB47]